MNRRIAIASAIALGCLNSAGFAQVKLEHKFAEGTARTKATTKVHQILTVNGTDVETNSVEAVTALTTVGTRRPDGNLPLQQTIEAIRAEISLPGGLGITYDSANPPAKKAEGPLAIFEDVFRALVGVSFTVVLDKANHVVAVEGTEKAEAKINELDPKAAELLKGRLTADKLKQAFERELGNFPDILVRKGDTWDRTETMDIAGGQSLTFQKRYEYLGTVEEGGKTLDKIGVKATAVTYAMDPNSGSPIKVGKSDLKIDSSEGMILFDRETGTIVERSGKNRITGDLTLTAGDQDLPSKLDLTLESNSKTEVQSDKK